MTTLTNPSSLTRFQTNLHMMINIKSLGQNCRPLSCETSLVARSEERLLHTYIIMVQEMMLLQKGKKDLFNDAKQGRFHNWVKNYIPYKLNNFCN